MTNEFLPCLQRQASFLSETQRWASAPCQRAVCQSACGSQITLWWRGTTVIVVCSLHPPRSPPPQNAYEDLWKTRAEPWWQRDRRWEAESHQWIMGSPARTQCSGTWGGYLTTWGRPIIKSRPTVGRKGEDFVPRKRDTLDTKMMDRTWRTSHFFSISAIFYIHLKCGVQVQTEQPQWFVP